MFVCCECCVLSGRGLYDELITRPEESYRLWCVAVCDQETSRMRRPWPALGRSAKGKKNYRAAVRIHMVTVVDISSVQWLNYVLSCSHQRQRLSPCLQNLLFPRTVICGCREKLNFTETSLLTVTKSWGTSIRLGVGSWRLAPAASFDFPPHATAWSHPITRQQKKYHPAWILMSHNHVTVPLPVLFTCSVTEVIYRLHSITPPTEMCHQMLREHEHSHPGASGVVAPDRRVQGAAKGPANWKL